MFATPSIISIAPPARLAPLLVIKAPDISTVPPVLNIAPPEPEVPVAIFPKISAKPANKLPCAFRVPPSL